MRIEFVVKQYNELAFLLFTIESLDIYMADSSPSHYFDK
jgi:hypothetical protein